MSAIGSPINYRRLGQLMGQRETLDKGLGLALSLGGSQAPSVDSFELGRSRLAERENRLRAMKQLEQARADREHARREAAEERATGHTFEAKRTEYVQGQENERARLAREERKQAALLKANAPPSVTDQLNELRLKREREEEERLGREATYRAAQKNPSLVPNEGDAASVDEEKFLAAQAGEIESDPSERWAKRANFERRQGGVEESRADRLDLAKDAAERAPAAAARAEEENQRRREAAVRAAETFKDRKKHYDEFIKRVAGAEADQRFINAIREAGDELLQVFGIDYVEKLKPDDRERWIRGKAAEILKSQSNYRDTGTLPAAGGAPGEGGEGGPLGGQGGPSYLERTFPLFTPEENKRFSDARAFGRRSNDLRRQNEVNEHLAPSREEVRRAEAQRNAGALPYPNMPYAMADDGSAQFGEPSSVKPFGRPSREVPYIESEGRRVDATQLAVNLLKKKTGNDLWAAISDMQENPEGYKARGIDIKRVIREVMA